MVIAAEQYASRLVVPTSQCTHPTQWASHKNLAAKTLRKLAGPHLPASLKQLEQAIARAHREYDTAVQQHAADRAAEQRSEQTGTPGEEHVDVGEEPVNDGEDDAVDDRARPRRLATRLRPSEHTPGRPQQTFPRMLRVAGARRDPQNALHEPGSRRGSGPTPPHSQVSLRAGRRRRTPAAGDSKRRRTSEPYNSFDLRAVARTCTITWLRLSDSDSLVGRFGAGDYACSEPSAAVGVNRDRASSRSCSERQTGRISGGAAALQAHELRVSGSVRSRTSFGIPHRL